MSLAPSVLAGTSTTVAATGPIRPCSDLKSARFSCFVGSNADQVSYTVIHVLVPGHVCNSQTGREMKKLSEKDENTQKSTQQCQRQTLHFTLKLYT